MSRLRNKIFGFTALVAVFLIGWNSHKSFVYLENKRAMDEYSKDMADLELEIYENIEASKADDDGPVAGVVINYFNRLQRK